MPNPQIRSPVTSCNSHEAIKENIQSEYTRLIIREALANIAIAVMVAVVMWSCVLGMSGNMGPGEGVIVGPIAEVDHDGR